MSQEKTSSNLRLLILSCSSKKRSTPDLLPALERYDGPAYRVMNKFLRTYPSGLQSLDVYILSAEFGLISSDKPIPNYNRRMTPQRAKELQQPTLNKLKHILIGKQYKELFISLGKDYLRVLAGFESLIPVDVNVTVSTRAIGYKLGELRNWLYGEASRSSNNQAKVVQQGKAYLRGVEITYTSEQVIEIAHTALAKEQSLPKCQMWYVQVGNQQVPPKWLVNQLTGLSVSAFHTDEAKRVLQQLGIKVFPKG
jgi:hypothetical protein